MEWSWCDHRSLDNTNHSNKPSAHQFEQTIISMKTISVLSLVVTTSIPVLLNSCSSNAPYSQWNGAGGTGAAPTSNPYGVPQAGGEVGTYAQSRSTEAAPYQPLPGVAQPSNPPAPVPANEPIVGGSSHTVVAGDSLWGISRKYGTTVEAIQAANGLTGTTIRTGQQLAIPGR